MKYKTIIEYLFDEIKSELDDIQCILNHPTISQNFSIQVKEFIGSILNKLGMIGE